MKILIIEDDRNINKLICETLKNFGQIESAYDGKEGLYFAEQNIYDCIILDIMLPEIDGFEVLVNLRKFSSVPVLMLTAKDAVPDKVRGLKLGADDYLVKPFNRDELTARVEALLRRKNRDFKKLSLIFKGLKLDIENHTVTIGNDTIELSGKSFDILEYMMNNKNIIITKEQIFNRIWGFDSDTMVTVVEVYFSVLRKNLKEYGYDVYLKTVRNVGYILTDRDVNI